MWMWCSLARMETLDLNKLEHPMLKIVLGWLWPHKIAALQKSLDPSCFKLFFLNGSQAEILSTWKWTDKWKLLSNNLLVNFHKILVIYCEGKMACSGSCESIKLVMHCNNIGNCGNGRSQSYKSIRSHSALHIDLQDPETESSEICALYALKSLHCVENQYALARQQCWKTGKVDRCIN